MSAAVAVLVPAPATTTMSGIFRAQAFTLEYSRAGENSVILFSVSVPVNGAVFSGEGMGVSAAISRTGGNVVIRTRGTRSRVSTNGTVLSGKVEVVSAAISRTGGNVVIRIRVTRSRVSTNGTVLSGGVEVVLVAISRTGENGMPVV